VTQRRVLVPSASEPGVRWLVTLDEHGKPLRCSCPGWSWRGTCRHPTEARRAGRIPPPTEGPRRSGVAARPRPSLSCVSANVRNA